MGEATNEPVRLPPGPRIPKALMGIAFLTARHRAVAAAGRRYGSAFTVNLPTNKVDTGPRNGTIPPDTTQVNGPVGKQAARDAVYTPGTRVRKGGTVRVDSPDSPQAGGGSS